MPLTTTAATNASAVLLKFRQITQLRIEHRAHLRAFRLKCIRECDTGKTLWARDNTIIKFILHYVIFTAGARPDHAFTDTLINR